MDLINRLFGRPGKKNALALVTEEKSKLLQLLFLEKKHSSELLAELTSIRKAYSGVSQSGPFRNDCEGVSEATPKQKEILAFVKTKEKATALEVQEALHYKHRATASAMLSLLVRKGLLQRLNRGKLSCYRLP